MMSIKRSLAFLLIFVQVLMAPGSGAYIASAMVLRTPGKLSTPVGGAGGKAGGGITSTSHRLNTNSLGLTLNPLSLTPTLIRSQIPKVRGQLLLPAPISASAASPEPSLSATSSKENLPKEPQALAGRTDSSAPLGIKGGISRFGERLRGLPVLKNISANLNRRLGRKDSAEAKFGVLRRFFDRSKKTEATAARGEGPGAKAAPNLLTKPNGAQAGETTADSPKAPPEISNQAQPGPFKRFLNRLLAKTRIFQDPAKNKSFWMFFLGYQFANAGLQICAVTLPFLIKSFTQNSTAASGSQMAMSEEAFNSLLRKRRSTVRSGHLIAQVLAFMSLPFLAGKKKGGAKSLLVRSGLIRAAILTLVPLHFFIFMGGMPAAIAFGVLVGIFVIQSFFEGIFVGMTGVVSSDVLGSKEVTQEERSRANSVLTFTAAIMSIFVPIFAGKLAMIPDILGKVGSGSAVVFGVYAGVMLLSALFYGLTGLRAARTRDPEAAPGDPGPGMLAKIKAGFKAIFANRFFRTLLMIDAFALLIAEPLMFNVLPEFVEGVLAASTVSMNSLVGLPLIGWIFQGMVNSPMGYFGLLVAFGSAGSALASLFLNKVRRFLQRRGFVSEESRTLPFYGLALLEVAGFAGLAFFPAFWPVLLFWMMKSLVGGFIGVHMMGLSQKNLAKYSETERSSIIAGMSLTNMLMAVGSTLAYGLILHSIPISLSMTIAVGAVAALGLVRLAAPYLMFDKNQRARQTDKKP